jgi:non-ribosomal peptide synthetase component F
LEKVIGFFVNTLVLRNAVERGQSYLEVLRRERESSLEAYDHAEVPFERLVQELKVRRDPSRTPLFQVMFRYVTSHELGHWSLAGLQTEEISHRHFACKFDLSVLIVETSGQLTGVLEYSTELFDRGTILNILKAWETLLRSILENPTMEIGLLPILTQEEQGYILDEFNKAL